MGHRNAPPVRRRAQEPVIAAPSRRVTHDPQLAGSLLAWYAAHRRDLPWRRAGDPYAVWVSEIMLQQTRVATVIPYFERWMDRFPDVRALAAADEDDVLHCWQGLGYYSRARGLRNGAREVVERFGGTIPRTVAELRSLPGVGPYTAGAIASIAFGADEPAVDGNVVRVLTRLYALAGDPAKTPLKNDLWNAARALLPAGRAGDFNQALMELGAAVCTPRSPQCADCPARAHCAALREGETERYPELARRARPTPVTHVAALVRRSGRILVEKIPEDAPWWAGMWRLPTAEPGSGESDADTAVRAVREAADLEGKDAGAVTELVHHVTRFRITLRLREVVVLRALGNSGRTRWCTPAELADLALPAPYRKLVAFIES